MIKRHFRELSKSFGTQIGPEKSDELKRTKTDIENNLSRVLKLIKSEEQAKKEGNSRKETELVGLIEDFYNQYQSLYVLYGRLTGEYMKSAPRRTKRVSSLPSSSSDSEYFSSDDTEFNHSDFNSRISQRERYSSFVNTLEALKTQKSKEPNEFEAHEMKQLRAKNAELEVAVSVLHAKLKNNEEHAVSKTSELMVRINKLEQEAKSLRNHKGKIEEKLKRCKNEALNQKKEFNDQINVMQQNFESVSNKNKELEDQLEILEEKLAETASNEQNWLKEKQCFIERIKNLESQCSNENDLEAKLRNAKYEINTLQKQKSELELQNERNQKEYSKLNKQLTERQMEELAQGFRQKMEDNIRILHQRIHVAEQLNNENKNSYKLTKQKYEEENKLLGEKVIDYEDEIKMLKEKVWKLEADVSKEGGEKMNLIKTVTQYERKMGKLEKKLKEKDEELVSLGEMKREAIRQLCFVVEFHRDRCVYLKDLILKTKVRNMK